MSVTNAQKFLAALIAPLRDLETMWQQMIAMRDLNQAVAIHLDRLGKLVGAPREGADDDVYRRRIRATIATNKSAGTIDELLAIAELVVYEADAEYIVDNTGIAALILRVEDVAIDMDTAQVLIKLLRRAVLGGVRIVLEFWPEDVTAESAFQFDGETDDVSFPDTDDLGGGMWIDALE